MKRTSKLFLWSSASSYLLGVVAYVWHPNMWWPFLGGFFSGFLLMGGLSIRRLNKIQPQ